MKAEIISVGTELLLGQIHDTNSSFIAKKLALLGIDVYFKTVAGDNSGRLKKVFKLASKRADLIIVSGGLGPTVDDITKETLAEFLGYQLVLDNKILKNIKNKFKKFKIKMPEGNIKQALVFGENCRILKNKLGTAPGFIVTKNKKIYIIMPGVPVEMKEMFDKYVVTYLKKQSPKEIIYSRILKVIGLPESQVNKMIKVQFENYTNPTVALLAIPAEIKIRLTAKGKNIRSVKADIRKVEKEMRNILGDHVFGADEETMESVLGRMLVENKKTIAFAESCTGGLVGNRMTEISGASEYFLGSMVCYANEVKHSVLGVKNQTLKKFGAVSPETALEMASGVKKKTGADIGLSITGIAGPTGGTKQKPVGLVYMGIVTGRFKKSYKFMFYGNRNMIKFQASQYAMNLARRFLLGILE